jgi:hypothetical protein
LDFLYTWNTDEKGSPLGQEKTAPQQHTAGLPPLTKRLVTIGIVVSLFLGYATIASRNSIYRSRQLHAVIQQQASERCEGTLRLLPGDRDPLTGRYVPGLILWAGSPGPLDPLPEWVLVQTMIGILGVIAIGKWLTRWVEVLYHTVWR